MKRCPRWRFHQLSDCSASGIKRTQHNTMPEHLLACPSIELAKLPIFVCCCQRLCCNSCRLLFVNKVECVITFLSSYLSTVLYFLSSRSLHVNYHKCLFSEVNFPLLLVTFLTCPFMRIICVSHPYTPSVWISISLGLTVCHSLHWACVVCSPLRRSLIDWTD